MGSFQFQVEHLHKEIERLTLENNERQKKVGLEVDV